MRLHRLRFDIWFCLLVAYLVSLGTGAAASALSAATYDGYAEVHSAAPGQAGSPAGPEVPRAQSIAELLELDTFTVLSQGIAYRNEGAGYFEGSYLYNLASLRGTVAARIHTESVQDGEKFASGEVVLPVGRVIWADLEEDPASWSRSPPAIPWTAPTSTWTWPEKRYATVRRSGRKIML